MDLWVLGCSLAGMVGAGVGFGPAWGLGFGFGAVLGWLNLRLVRSGADALGRSARAGAPRHGRSAGMLRWALGLVVGAGGLYGIFVLHLAPWRAVVAGLFAAFAGVFLFAIAELLRPARLPIPNARPAPLTGAAPETEMTDPEP
ncbi:MAG: ATP synthase subunit I [Terriglobales bacterium]